LSIIIASLCVDMLIDIAEFDNRAKRFRYSYGPGEFNIQDESLICRREPVCDLSIVRKHEEVRISGSLVTEVSASCARCLIAVSIPVDLQLDLIYHPVVESFAEEPDLELSYQDLNLSYYANDVIDLDELIREQIQLALPVRVLCREECRGLCPVCGADRNRETCSCAGKQIDPLWEALAKLIEER